MEIIGFKHSSFKPRDGDQEISGYTLYLTEEREDVEGYAADRAFITDKKLGTYKPALGDNVRLLYNRFGKVDAVELMAY